MTERRVSPLEQAMADGTVDFDEAGHPYEVTSWAPVNLEIALLGGGVRPPEFFARTDDLRLIYAGRRHAFWGPSETFKSWVALCAAKDVIERGGKVLYIDFEDDEVGFVTRTRAIGIPDEWLLEGKVRYVHPEEPIVVEQKQPQKKPRPPQLDFGHLVRSRPDLVVLDGVTEAMTLHGWHPYDPMDTAKYQHLLARAWDGAVIEIDHTGQTRAGQASKTGQLGTQQKRAGLDGISMEFVAEQNEGPGGHSIVKLYLRKDRHGFVRQHVDKTGFLGRFHLITPDDAPHEAYVEPPKPRGQVIADILAEPDDGEADLKIRVLEYVQEHPSQQMSGLKKAKLGAWDEVRALVEGEEFRIDKGPNGSKLVSLNGSRNESR